MSQSDNLAVMPAHAAAGDHGPLQHHFESLEQQRDASSVGMWVFLTTEIMFFGGLFLGYLVYRLSHFAAFAAASSTLNMRIGAGNTIVLICSSLTMALSVHAAAVGARKTLLWMLGATMFLGLVFLGVKGYEWNEKYVEHHIPGHNFSWHEENDPSLAARTHAAEVNPGEAELFFSLYFAMTGMHAFHMVIGEGLLAWLFFKAWKGTYSPVYHTPVENIGLYWHFVDIVWIFLFPLLYLIDRHH